MYFRSGSTHPGMTEFYVFFYLLSVIEGWVMIVGIWRISFFLFGPWRRTLQEAGIIDMKLLVVCLTMTATASDINLISRWFAMVACSALVEN